VGERTQIEVSEFTDVYVRLSGWDVDHVLGGGVSCRPDVAPLPRRKQANLAVCMRPHAVPNFGIVLRERYVEHYIGAWLVSTLDVAGVPIDQRVVVTAGSRRQQLRLVLPLAADLSVARRATCQEVPVYANELLTDETARRRFDFLAQKVLQLIEGDNWPPAQ